MTGLNATQGSLLGFLHDGPRTGWDLLQEVEGGLSRFWNITSSHVYRELRALEARRLIRAGAPGARDRRPYTLTAAGRREFRAWLAQAPGPEQIRFPLLVTLWFGRHLDDDTLLLQLEEPVEVLPVHEVILGHRRCANHVRAGCDHDRPGGVYTQRLALIH